MNIISSGGLSLSANYPTLPNPSLYSGLPHQSTPKTNHNIESNLNGTSSEAIEQANDKRADMPAKDFFFPMSSKHIFLALGAAAIFLGTLQVLSLIIMAAADHPTSDGDLSLNPIPGGTGSDASFNSPAYIGALSLIYIGFLLPIIIRVYKFLDFKSIIFFIAVVGLCIQYALHFNAIFDSQASSSLINLSNITTASISFTAVLISLGSTIEYLSPFQMSIVAVIEILLVTCTRHLISALSLDDYAGILGVHMFGSFFGLGMTIMLSRHSFLNIGPIHLLNSKHRGAVLLSYWERMRLNHQQLHLFKMRKRTEDQQNQLLQQLPEKSRANSVNHGSMLSSYELLTLELSEEPTEEQSSIDIIGQYYSQFDTAHQTKKPGVHEIKGRTTANKTIASNIFLEKYYNMMQYFSIVIFITYFSSFNSIGGNSYASYDLNNIFQGTLLCICSSIVISFALGNLFNDGNKVNLIREFRTSAIAGGIAVGDVSQRNVHTFIFVLIGIIIGFLSSLKLKSIFPNYGSSPFSLYFNHDSLKVFRAHGMSSIVGSISSIIVLFSIGNKRQALLQLGGIFLVITIATVSGAVAAELCKNADAFLSRYFIILKRLDQSLLELNRNISFNSAGDGSDIGDSSPDSPATPARTSSVQSFGPGKLRRFPTLQNLQSLESQQNLQSMTRKDSGPPLMRQDSVNEATLWSRIRDILVHTYSTPSIDGVPCLLTEFERDMLEKLDVVLIDGVQHVNSDSDILAFRNHQFTLFYDNFIINDWDLNYFAYDHLKDVYKELKDNKKNVSKIDYVSYQEAYETIFLREIVRVDNFICRVLKDIESDFTTMRDFWFNKDSAGKASVLKNDIERANIERNIRSIYETCNNLQSFHKLNDFVICKIVKKYEKLHSSKGHKSADFIEWKKHGSFEYFNKHFITRKSEIDDKTRKVIDFYSTVFRQTYTKLAEGELKYVKIFGYTEGSTTLFQIGLKLGLVFTAIIWMLMDIMSRSDVGEIWSSPALYVFSSLGSFLVFKLTWIYNTWIWSKFHINYASLLQLTKANSAKPLLYINELSSLLIIFVFILIVYFKSINPDSLLYLPKLAHSCPVALLILLLFYELYSYMKFRNTPVSRGLFDWETLKLSFCTPFVPVRFRDNYSCDVLTSFTKIIIDSSYALCFFISGASFLPSQDSQTLTDFGSSYLNCVTPAMLLYAEFIVILPLWIRSLQCLRNCYDHSMTPHIFNFIKYMSGIIVIIYGYFRAGLPDHITLVIIVTLYKWWWDVVMDWGLFTNIPTNFSSFLSPKEGEYPFLRKNLLYYDPRYYYLAIVLDLLFRFLWVVSLVPATYSIFGIGPKLSLFMGTCEIMRRSMWGIFRVEWEHLKFVDKHVIGYKLEHTYNSKKN